MTIGYMELSYMPRTAEVSLLSGRHSPITSLPQMFVANPLKYSNHSNVTIFELQRIHDEG